MTTPDYTDKQAVLRAFDPTTNSFRTSGGSSGSGAGNLLDGVVFDAVVASYPNSVTEVYEYKQGGAGGTLQATITVVYTSPTKEFIQSAVKT